ncbi:MAG: ShlB/FhaC/HecB family hemolysin secretion/activation protein [Alphaproteobacteria bacterium]|nr:MAG: ShlB/FhaC/HecB family hemolysin secretion/activation protein [Alphaproteobacteria bacterium]
MTNLHQQSISAAVAFVFCALSGPAIAQEALDRLDPAQVEREREIQAIAPATHQKVELEVTEPSGAPAGRGSILVGAVTFTGLRVLTPADFAEIIASRAGSTLNPAELAALATAVADRARAKGFPFATAWIEPQRVASGVLTLNVDEGVISEIRFEGFAPPSLRRSLAPLANGEPARLADVERRLLLTGDIDGVRIRSARFFRENGRSVLLVRATQDRFAVRAQISNEGTRPLGPVQVRIDADLNALLFSDDALTVTYTTTPADLDELQFGRARYAKRVASGGTEIGITGLASRARPGSYLAHVNLESRSWFLGMDVLQPLSRQRRSSFWLQAELGVRDLKQRRQGVLVRHDRVAAARLTFYGYADVAGGRMRVSSTASRGLGLFDATRAGDPLASRADADGIFTSLTNWADWTSELGQGVSLRLALQSQISSDPLLIAEEAGLGGGAFLRGYDWSERTGDQAAMGMVELRYLLDQPFDIIRRAQLYAFLDGGKVTNLRGGYGSGTLASAGGGVRADITKAMGANVEVAVPLTGARYDTGDGSPKLNLRIVRSF